jgi:membrane-associated protease RseP (regulator of RpoE activity)
MKPAKTALRAAPAALAVFLAWALCACAADAKQKVAYLGVQVGKADETLREQLKLSGGVGLTVREVVAKSPAEEAGLKQYDILEKLDDQLLFNGEQLAGLVRSHKPGDKVALSIIRQGQPQKLEVTLSETELPKTAEFSGFGETMVFSPDGTKLHVLKELEKALKLKDLQKELTVPFHLDVTTGRGKPEVFLGVEAKPVESSLAAQLGLKEDTGVLVGHVVDESPAEKAGLKEHDVVVKLDKESVQGPRDLVKRIQAHKQGDKVKLEFIRGGKPQEVEATLAEKAKPESKQLRTIRRQYQVVAPRVEVIEAPNGEDECVIILKTATEEVLDDQIKDADRAKDKPSAARVIVHSTVRGKTKAGEVLPGASVQTSQGLDTLKNSVMILRSDEGVITLQEDNGHRVVTVKDPQDKTVFEGAIDSTDERAKLPPDVRKRLEKLEGEVKAKTAAPKDGEEIRVRVPKRQPGFIQYERPLARPGSPTLL